MLAQRNDRFVLFDNRLLVPTQWRGQISETDPSDEPQFRVFNPSIIAVDGGFAMIYRVVDETHNLRRLATCRLSLDLDLDEASVTPLSDLISFADPENLNERALTWHADARYFRLQGDLYISWNDGANKPQNHQFMVRMADDGLVPQDLAKELTSDLERRDTEKNWMFFDDGSSTWAIYSIHPHQLLAASLNETTSVPCHTQPPLDWACDYEEFYGTLRGSAQPLLIDGRFLTIAHSSYKTSHGRVYRACFYEFENAAPFRVLRCGSVPFALPNPVGDRFMLPQLNEAVHSVVYPCGLAQKDDQLVVSYGINDELCAVALIPLQEALASLSPVQDRADTAPLRGAGKPRISAKGASKTGLPVFWWDAAGKKFDGKFGNRKFETGNFGDIAAAEVVAHATGLDVRAPGRNERKILSIGSVLHTAKDGDVIWGTGAKGTKMHLDPQVKNLHAYAVRGPLTLGVLLRSKIDISKITHLFDPGVIIPSMYKEELDQHRASLASQHRGPCIIPHYRDDLLFRREYPEYAHHMVKVDCTPLDMCKALCGADFVISSSLHGIIFAEAMGIPAYWHAPQGGEDETKFYDYYYGTDRYHVKRFTDLETVFKSEPMPLPTFDIEAYLATFPHAVIDDLLKEAAVANERKGPTPSSAINPFPAFNVAIGYENFLPPIDGGHWCSGNEAAVTLSTAKPDSGVGSAEVVLSIVPHNSSLFQRPQRIEVLVNGEQRESVEWDRGDEAERQVRVTVAAPNGTLDARIELRARNARSPRSVRDPERDYAQHPLSFCLNAVDVTPVRAAKARRRWFW